MQEVAQHALPCKKRKTLSIALAGCSGKAVAYIGLLEVLGEHGIPVDGIAACSSGSLVAGAYACGHLAEFKAKAFSLTSREILNMFEPTFRGGMFSFGRGESLINEFIDVENIEDLPVRTVIVASDLVTGTEVVFSMGSVMRAVKASCSMPGLFEPVIWGRQVLVDGGLFSIVPVEAAKILDCDRVVAVRLQASSKNLFETRLLKMKNGYNHTVRGPIHVIGRYAKRLSRSLFGDDDEDGEIVTINADRSPSMVEVLGKSLDYAIEERKKIEQYSSDLMIEIDGEEFGKLDTENFHRIYEAGRAAAERAVPQIKEMLA